MRMDVRAARGLGVAVVALFIVAGAALASSALTSQPVNGTSNLPTAAATTATAEATETAERTGTAEATEAAEPRRRPSRSMQRVTDRRRRRRCREPAVCPADGDPVDRTVAGAKPESVCAVTEPNRRCERAADELARTNRDGFTDATARRHGNPGGDRDVGSNRNGGPRRDAQARRDVETGRNPEATRDPESGDDRGGDGSSGPG